MITTTRRSLVTVLIIAGMVLTALAYFPGLKGPWLLDDYHNLGVFNEFSSNNAPYHDLIFGNHSGPLGRPVALASFAVNHVTGFFSSFSLKSTNLLIHLLNGLLVFQLIRQLLRTRSIGIRASTPVLAACISLWWLLLPLHTSSVLYIVQRMTLLMATFSLACCLSYVLGRRLMQEGNRLGIAAVAAALLVFLPLSALAKESGFTSLAWLFLIELFFFQKFPIGRFNPGHVLAFLVACTVALAALLVEAFSLDARYIWREFTLTERLLSQPRAIWSYVHAIFLPDGSRMGIYHDDFAISRGLLSPWTTLPALIGLAGALLLAIRMASSSAWWPVAFGILFYLSGHLVESTIVPLELYFEHRNYLPAVGLLIALSVAALNLWTRSWRLPVAVFAAYIGLLAVSTYQRAHIWGDGVLLIGISAKNHPHSLRAWADYSEALLADGKPGPALQAAALTAQRNPDFAAISYLQMISIYCRLRQAPPPPLVNLAANELTGMEGYQLPLSIGLDDIFTRKQKGDCRSADFSALVPGLLAQEAKLHERFGPRRTRYWLLRLTMAEWLIELGREPEALVILRDIWLNGNKSLIPTVGLELAEALHRQRLYTEKQRILHELAAVSQDAPQDFIDQINRLRRNEDRP